MRIHSKRAIGLIRTFRKQGNSIQELAKRFQIPKTTVWHHVHDIKLSPGQIRSISKRRGGSRVRSQRRQLQAQSEAKSIVDALDNIEGFAPLILALLYWAEGSKKSFVFTNTDENMISLFISIITDCFGVSSEDIVVIPRISQSSNSAASISHWHRVTGISRKNIWININYQHNKSKAKYGICRIIVKRGSYLLKVVNHINIELTSRIKSANIKQLNRPLSFNG